MGTPAGYASGGGGSGMTPDPAKLAWLRALATPKGAIAVAMVAEAGARFSSVLCGRAMWQEGIPAYVSGGVEAFAAWLARDGVRNLERINACLAAAAPWDRNLTGTEA